MAEPLDEQQGDLLLGRGQEPAIELPAHRLAETAQESLRPPARGIRGGFPQVNPEGGGLTTKASGPYPEGADAGCDGEQAPELWLVGLSAAVGLAVLLVRGRGAMLATAVAATVPSGAVVTGA